MSKRWLWTQKEDIGPIPRLGHAMAYDATRQRVVLFSGSAGRAGPVNDTWEWDGHAWTQVADMGPAPRQHFRMSYDTVRQRLVLFGGIPVKLTTVSDDETLGDTWEWNGTEWTQVADIGPGPRVGHALTYDTVRQRAVLFGGYDPGRDNKFFNDTWAWDGTEWTQIDDTGPPARIYPTMVFDGSRECLVLFGGWATEPKWLGDTWETVMAGGWVKLQDMGPLSMADPKMAYTEKHTVLFGYPEGAGGAGHTWEWDGGLWTQRQDIGPPTRAGYDLAYDNQRERVVLFGGLATGHGSSLSGLNDTWELAIIEQ
jgi:hypothetical protein